MALSGHGSTLGFGTTTTFSPGYTSIGGWGLSRESLDTSTLATTGARTKIGGDLYDIEPFTSSYFLDPDTLATTEANAIDDLLFDSGAVSASETVTITFPNSGAATAAGAAHVTGWNIEDLVTDKLIVCSITTQFNDWPTIAE
ncbi:MAG: hypothetical protein KDA57_17765 [Planctomycetales bacterium]|nr:hypothetical protein [Planctomycetales bacterium]